MRSGRTLLLLALNVLLCGGFNAWGESVTLDALKVSDSALAEQSSGATEQTIAVEKEAVAPSTLAQALKKQFYLELQKSGEYSSEPYIRGRGTNGVPVFLEGMRINMAHSDSVNLFNLMDIEQIDVYRGPSGATLGMGAMSGAVVMKFKDPQFSDSSTFRLGGSLDARTALFSTSGFTTTLGARAYNDRFNIAVGGSSDDYDDYEDGAGDEVKHSNYETAHYHAALAAKTSDDSYVYVRYLHDKADSQDPFSRYRNNGVWFYTDRPDDEAETCFIGYKDAELGGLKDVHFQLFGTDQHYDYNTKKEAAVSEAVELFRDTETRGGKLSAKKELGDHLLSFSGGYSQMKVTNGLRRYNNVSRSWNPWTNAYGITDGEFKSYQLNAADDLAYEKAFFNLSGGYEFVRRQADSNVNSTALSGLVPAELLDQIQQKDTNKQDHLLSFSATVGYEFNPAFIPYVKLSNATRTPYLNEAYTNNPSNGSQIPNQDLDNESVWAVDVGADGRIASVYYNGAVYYQDYDDYIELAKTGYQTTGGLPIKQFVNLDDARVYGVEALLGYALGGDRFIEAAYLYTYGKNETDDQPLAFIAPQKLTFTLAQRRDKGLSWQVEEELVDRQDRVSAVSGEVETPGYAVTNLAASYAFADFGWMKNPVLGCELNNLFDREYRRHLDKVSSTAWYLPNEAGINGLLSLRMEF